MSPTKPEQLVKRLDTLGLPAAAISDINTLSGNIDFYKALKKASRKSIMGTQLNVSLDLSTKHEKENRKTYGLNLIAKNKTGWKNLIKIITLSNRPEHFYHKPRLSVDELAPYTEGIICLSGSVNSLLAHDIKQKEKLISLFGKEGLFIEVQTAGGDGSADKMRELAVSSGLEAVAVASPYYLTQEDAYDQRILLCSLLSATFPQMQAVLAEGNNDDIAAFFRNTSHYLPSYQEMLALGHKEKELENTNVVASMCESYDVLNKPMLPEFKCPPNFNPDTYLRELCRDGWRKRIAGKVGGNEAQYVETVKYELSVLQGAGLSSYFLILNDICKFIEKKRWLPNVGRGSAAGCLVSFLANITQVDPIKYGLIFSRFYNEGRNTKDRVSMPDIDLDVPATKRDEVIAYIKSVYGDNKVGQICAFQTMKGRGAMKEVLRAYGVTPFHVMNLITDPIPDEAKIADDLQLMKEEEGESSIIRWTLENEPKKLEEWAVLKDDGSIEGPLSKRFEQAIRLEGTRKSYGRHASGIVVSSIDLQEMCPLILNKEDDSMMCGYEMKALEDVGGVKFDVLGLTLMDKLQGVADIARYGDVSE